MATPRFELTSQRQKDSRLPIEPPGRPAQLGRAFGCIFFQLGDNQRSSKKVISKSSMNGMDQQRVALLAPPLSLMVARCAHLHIARLRHLNNPFKIDFGKEDAMDSLFFLLFFL